MMAMAGADVTLCARSLDLLQQVIDEIKEYATGRIVIKSIDLENLPMIDRLIDEVLAELGPVHILVNNSGGPPGGPLLSNSVEDFHAPSLDIYMLPIKSLKDSLRDGESRIRQGNTNYFDFCKRANSKFGTFEHITWCNGKLG